ncbi:asparagine synthase (glutamine-hydrolyzing) [Pontibacter sp. 172403-2]|uniref:asparagine synthase (glutamine-hydrolyzing) n=1 Tax=Pontibacter rufus TaxID=2791028 RepID=UPI0018AFFBD0|nr:asparagine synthase (glutamine-hydrolyzing) [Pontibacter sp. 172403-2]MBF9254967.1 asparagine synthase (glutamine-hydrolyzing) [Pontibacter sp. 172403-2]
MCGISGIISLKEKQVDSSLIKAYNDIISHRGPDDDGFFFYKNLAFGHRRLSILDLSPAGHQPMHLGEKYTLVFNGEIFNYLEIKQELQKAGYSFVSGTDSEVILAAYDYWQETCVKRFNGMWAFAILDRSNDTLFCSRDRFGVKPFYYRKTEAYFAFASEIKQFSTLPDWQPVLHTSRAADFIRHGIFDHTADTLFSDVKQLRGGHNLVFNLSDSSVSVYQWYNLRENVAPYKGTFQEAKQEFFDLFTDAVKLRLRSDVKVGSCLSGGLDSTSIVCSVNKVLREENKHDIQETVSACSSIKKYDEQQFIDEVINKTGVKSHKVYPDLDTLFDALDTLVWHQDEPFSSSSIFAQWCVFEEARKNGLIVMLDGQGADESLAGYPPFHDAHLMGLLKDLKLGRIMEETAALQNLHGYSAKKAWQFVAKSIMPSGLAQKLRQTSTPILQDSISNTEDCYSPAFFSSITDMSYDQLCVSNLPMLLHYEDRNSMAHSIESRVPFLDYRLVEFIVSLPDDYKIHNGKTKYVLREALDATIPDKIKNRHDKMGFVTPETVWIQQHKDAVRQKLTEACKDLNQLVNPDQIMASFDKLIKGEEDIHIGSVYFRLLTFHQWFKKFGIVLKNN